MNRLTRQCWLGLALGAFGHAALAIGFGAVPSSATLGQPVDLQIPLRLEPGEDIAQQCVSAEVLFADTPQQPGTTTATLEPAAPGVNQRMLRVRTSTRINEPVVTIEVAVGCSSRISRRFTLFADPPLFEPPPVLAGSTPTGLEMDAAVAPPTSAATAPAATAPLAETQEARPPKPKARPKKSRPRPEPGATVAGIQTAPVPTARAAGSGTVGAPTSRLQLATLEPGANPTLGGAGAAAVAAANALAADADATAAAAATAAASAASAAEAATIARTAELEASANRARADADRAQQRINELQAQLRQAQSDRSNAAWTYVLGLMLLAAVIALWWLWRQREQERQANQWLQAAAKSRAGAPDDSSEDETVVASPPSISPSRLTGFDDTTAATRTAISSRPGVLGAPISAAVPTAPERREVSVEELIDLEQQAEFFVVLGQDEAAIDLLMSHLRSTSGASPLPYLKLLEIYKRRGEHGEYERLRERFNQRFAGNAPAWDTDLQGGLTLEEYPAVIAQLQRLWPQPQRAMDVLQATLLREPSEEGDVKAGSFDLPAYRELMLLYSVARDLSEAGEDSVPVDLLLPLDDPAPPVSSFTMTPGTERLAATTPLDAQPSALAELEVDLPLDDVDASTSILEFAPTDIVPDASVNKGEPDVRR